MAIEVFQVRTARSRVEEYASESDDLAARCAQANECRDLEDFLELGIGAYAWIERADLWLRAAVAKGSLPRDEEESISDAIDALCAGWLRPCKFAREWIARVRGMGFQIDNLERFEDCCAQMESIVNSQQSDAREMSPALIGMEAEALKEHRDGETVEFVPET